MENIFVIVYNILVRFNVTFGRFVIVIYSSWNNLYIYKILIIFTVYADGQYDACGDKAAHLLKILDTEDLPDKHVHMSSLHSYLGNVCMSKKDYERGLDHHNKDLAIGEKQ
jgi:hypothetical protein